jgi:hypothetical protein
MAHFEYDSDQGYEKSPDTATVTVAVDYRRRDHIYDRTTAHGTTRILQRFNFTTPL